MYLKFSTVKDTIDKLKKLYLKFFEVPINANISSRTVATSFIFHAFPVCKEIFCFVVDKSGKFAVKSVFIFTFFLHNRISKFWQDCLYKFNYLVELRIFRRAE
ncbi:hypothetical protein GCAAIG_08745 [Candidatus Electronema halotolerans]